MNLFFLSVQIYYAFFYSIYKNESADVRVNVVVMSFVAETHVQMPSLFHLFQYITD